MADLEQVNALLPSVINYHKLDNYRWSGLNDDCVKLKGNDDKDDIKNFHNICMSITGVIDSFNEINIHNSFDNNKCTVFALWMYDYLIKELKNRYDYSKIEKFINIINPIFIRYSSKIGCTIPSYIGIERYVDTLKILYDFAINYDTLMVYIRNNRYKCSEEFSKYIEEKVKLLYELKEHCVFSREAYCQVLNDIFKKPIREEKLLKLGCTKVSSDEIKRILEEKLQHQNFEEEHDIFLDVHDRDPRISFHAQERNKRITSNEPSSTSSNNIMGTTLPVIGSVFTMSLLYRLTPVGNWINSRLRGNGRRSHNLYNMAYGPQGGFSAPEELNSFANEFNISYGPE
ncbi:Plasmodium vivax Vir protein, putative [Plasmodium vivax]|uniref:Vir protein, putative n=1 Tax=Plasmodium vivax TaxID=5855 RepID=A0A1G4EE89_PLAVI|nr:Plasmodium vivax Vir protein, putative [Plasmodium vivax]